MEVSIRALSKFYVEKYVRNIKRAWLRTIFGLQAFLPLLKTLLRLLSATRLTDRSLERRSLGELLRDKRAVVINLESRRDRRKLYTEEFERLFGHQPVRFAAIRHANGSLGCASSHLRVLTAALLFNSLQPFAVFEDDVEFLGSRDEIEDAISNFLADRRLDVLLLAYHTRFPMPRLRSGLRIVTDAHTTAAYVVKADVLSKLVLMAGESVRGLEAGNPADTHAIDVVWQELQRHELIFVAPARRLARQRKSWSDIEGQVKNYGV